MTKMRFTFTKLPALSMSTGEPVGEAKPDQTVTVFASSPQTTIWTFLNDPTMTDIEWTVL